MGPKGFGKDKTYTEMGRFQFPPGFLQVTLDMHTCGKEIG